MRCRELNQPIWKKTVTDNIKDKVVVITGASSGPGAETARPLLKADVEVVLGARRIDRLEARASEPDLSKEAAFKVDVTDREQVKALVDHPVKLPRARG